MEAKGQTEQALRDEMRQQFDRDAVSRQLMIDKLQQNFKDTNKVSEADYKKSVTKLNLRQIVIRPKAPAPTDKDPKAGEKSIAEARARADKIVAQLKPLTGGALSAQFATIAGKQSDDAATKTKGGAVGFKTPAEMSVPTGLRDALSNATTDLVGPLQDEASPTRDFYIFLIQGRQLELPKDYAKKKAQLLKDYETQRDNDAWSAQIEKIKKAAPVEIYDPALQAYKIQSEQVVAASGAETDRLRREALAKYEESLGFAGPTQAAAIHYQMAHLYQELKQPAKQIENLQASIKNSGQSVMVRLELARALRETKKTKEAIAQLQEASKALTDNPPPASMFGGGNPADAMRMQISSEFETLGRRDLATAERARIAPPQGMPGMPPGMGGMQGLPPGVSMMPNSGAMPGAGAPPASPPSAAEFGGKAPVPPPPAASRPTTSRPADAPRGSTRNAPQGAKPAANTPPVSAPTKP
jgi:tetratricopeptide (TPR) repeat protein